MGNNSRAPAIDLVGISQIVPLAVIDNAGRLCLITQIIRSIAAVQLNKCQIFSVCDMGVIDDNVVHYVNSFIC